MSVKSAGSVTRLALYGGGRKNYGSFAGKTGGGPTGRIMSSLAGAGGLASRGGIAGIGGGLAG